MSGARLVVWKHLPALRAELGEPEGPGTVRENVDRLAMGGLSRGGFSDIASGLQHPQTIQHDVDLVGRLLALAAPGARIRLGQAVRDEAATTEANALPSAQQLVTTLRLSGLIDVSEPQTVQSDHPEEVARHLGLTAQAAGFRVVSVEGRAPEFAQGSSQLLSFAKPAPVAARDPAVNAVWSIDNLNDEEVDLVDDEALLDETDLIKPSAESLRVCGTTGQRKACKDCSCGLQAELDAGQTPTTSQATSSCGSCYLGDAFRCASCPYLGMPAFKPGEKIALSQRQLNADA